MRLEPAHPPPPARSHETSRVLQVKFVAAGAVSSLLKKLIPINDTSTRVASATWMMGLWKCRVRGKSGKAKTAFPRLSSAPWKSRKQREISTFPQPATTVDLPVQEPEK